TLLTTGTKANTLETKNNNDSTIKIYSARDEITYVIWFDKGEGEQPSEVNTIAVRINIADLDDSDQVGPVLYDRLLLLGAFDIELSNDNELLIYNIENGESSDTDTPNSTPSTDIGTGWDIINIQPGEGEDASNNIVLLDGHPSVSINLDLTARSLVNVI